LEEIAEETGFSEEVVKKSLESYKKCRSLDAPIDEDGDSSLGGLMEDHQIERPDTSVLKLFFGIDRKYPMNLGDISDMMGISRERVRQIKDRGLDMLRMASKKMEVDFSLN